MPIPHDCRDGFLGAFWRRPEAYLDPAVRAGISSFAQAAPGQVEPGPARLAEDLRSGGWHGTTRSGSERASTSVTAWSSPSASEADPAPQARSLEPGS
jgi:hypothetical protein